MKRVGQIHQEGPDGHFHLVVVHGQCEKSSNVFYSGNLIANNIRRTDYRYSLKLWSATIITTSAYGTVSVPCRVLVAVPGTVKCTVLCTATVKKRLTPRTVHGPTYKQQELKHLSIHTVLTVRIHLIHTV
jgi:hypothetical protein